ncbi:PQQ-binding-like beta-propeller repeat protein [bacterium]|nr:PQQ-binding-like beta-propeller repeat protein [bacterium]
MRTLSVPPQDGRDRVTLSYSAGALRWHYRNTGDYDQNGEVNAADLIPLAKLLGTFGGPFESSTIESVVDGDGNGEINIGDVAPIAQHYGVRLTGYSIYASGSQLDYPGAGGLAANGTGTSTAGLLSSQNAVNKAGPAARHAFEIAIALQPAVNYWVRPLDGTMPGIASNLISGEGWLMPGVDARHSGQSPFSGPPEPTLRWEIPGNGESFTAAVVGPDSTAYVGNSDGFLRAYTPVGTEKWSYDAAADITASLALSTSAELLLPAANGLHMLDGQGALRWFHSDHGSILGVTVDGGSGLILATARRSLLALDMTGKLLWELSTESLFEGPAVVSGNGDICICTRDGTLYSLDRQGQLQWELEIGSTVMAVPSIAADGIILLGSDDGAMYSISAAGEVGWKYQTQAPIRNTAAIDRQGNIYFASNDGRLLSLTADGLTRWTYYTDSNVQTSVQLDAAGFLYAGNLGGMVYCLSTAGELQWKYDNKQWIYEDLCIGPGSTLYIAAKRSSVTSKFSAFGPPAGQPVATDGSIAGQVHINWPEFSGADGYEVQYRAEAGKLPVEWTLLTLTEGKTTTSTIHRPGGSVNCEADTVYQYRFRPGAGGDSLMPWSGIDSGYWSASAAGFGAFPMACYDSGQTNRSPFAGPELDRYNWSFNSGSYTISPPVVSASGDSYFTADTGILFSVSADAEQNWQLDLLCSSYMPPALQPDGRIIASGLAGGLSCISPEGAVIWQQDAYAEFAPPFRIDGQGRIYIVDRLEGIPLLRVLDAAGDTVYEYEIPGYWLALPAISNNQEVYLATTGPGLIKLDRDGQQLWSRSLPYQFYDIRTICLGPDGNAYVLNAGSSLIALDSAGEELWQTSFKYGLADYGMALAADGTLYFSDAVYSSNGGAFAVTAIAPDGRLKWQCVVDGEIAGSPVVDGKGGIFVSMRGIQGKPGGVIELWPDGTIRSDFRRDWLDPRSGPVFAQDGSLLVAEGRFLVSIGGSHGGVD